MVRGCPVGKVKGSLRCVSLWHLIYMYSSMDTLIYWYSILAACLQGNGNCLAEQ